MLLFITYLLTSYFFSRDDNTYGENMIITTYAPIISKIVYIIKKEYNFKSCRQAKLGKAGFTNRPALT